MSRGHRRLSAAFITAALVAAAQAQSLVTSVCAVFISVIAIFAAISSTPISVTLISAVSIPTSAGTISIGLGFLASAGALLVVAGAQEAGVVDAGRAAL